MSDLTRTTINSEADREPTAEELANAPIMSPQERTEIMRSEQYAKSSLVRKIVAASIAKSDPMQHAEEGPEEQPYSMVEAKQAYIQNLFKDKRYKTDAAYRFEVHKQLAQLTAGDNAAVVGESAYTPNQTFSISTSRSPYHGADLRVNKLTRVVLSTGDETGPNAPAKPKADASEKK